MNTINLMSFYFLNLAQAGSGGADISDIPKGNPLMQMLPMMFFLIVIFYFLIIRPQKIKQRDLEKKVSSLKKGDKIITNGGIHGIIHALRERTVVVRVANNLNIEFEKTAVLTILPSSKELAAKSSDTKK